MTELASTFVGCVVQVTVVALAGLVVAWLAARRSTTAAASALVSAAATILVVTALVPAPRPAVSFGGLWANHGHTVETQVVASRGSAMASAEDAPIESQSPAGPATSVGEVIAAVRRLGAVAEHNVEHTQAGIWIAGLLALGAAIGIVRFIAALAYVRRLRRGSTPVTCPRLLGQFGELAQVLGVRRPVALHERREWGSPAVVGWRRPIVLLPAEHRAWTEDQRRAALAHELAHIACEPYPSSPSGWTTDRGSARSPSCCRRFPAIS